LIDYLVRATASIATLAIAWSVAAAQDEPPVQEPPPAEEEEELKPRIRWNSLTVGYAGWDVSGNRRRLFQYATPPSGLTIFELDVLHPWSERQIYGSMSLRGNPWQDRVAQGTLIFNGGRTMVRGLTAEHEFYEPAWHPVQPSETRVTEVTAQHSFAPEVGAFYLYREGDRRRSFPAPLSAEDYRTETHAMGFGARVGRGQAGVTVVDRRFFDRTAEQPNTLQQQIDGHYGTDLGPSLNLEGRAGYARIEQPGRPDSHVRNLSLVGNWDLAPRTSLQFNMSRQDADLNVVQNAYVQRRFNTGARIVHRWPGWTGQLGFRHREHERLRADQAFVDVPKWNTFDARLYGRLTDELRLSVRAMWEDLQNGAAMETLDPRDLYWHDRRMVQARVSGGDHRLNGYGSYTFRYRRNADRRVDVGWHNLSVGSSFFFSEDLLGYAEVAYDQFGAGGLRDELGESLDDYFPNSISLGFGVDWTRGPSETVSTSMNFFSTNNYRGTQLTVSYRRPLSDDHDLELVFAPWRFEDRLFGLTGYNAALVQARYTVRF
jgi:hypothetical protein